MCRRMSPEDSQSMLFTGVYICLKYSIPQLDGLRHALGSGGLAGGSRCTPARRFACSSSLGGRRHNPLCSWRMCTTQWRAGLNKGRRGVCPTPDQLTPIHPPCAAPLRRSAAGVAQLRGWHGGRPAEHAASTEMHSPSIGRAAAVPASLLPPPLPPQLQLPHLHSAMPDRLLWGRGSGSHVALKAAAQRAHAHALVRSCCPPPEPARTSQA